MIKKRLTFVLGFFFLSAFIYNSLLNCVTISNKGNNCAIKIKKKGHYINVNS